MRITIVYDCLFPWTRGGGERVYRMLAEDLVELGHEVTYVTRIQWPDDDPPQIEGVKVVGLLRAELYDDDGVRRNTTALRFALALGRYLRRHRDEADAVIVCATPVLNVFAARWLGRCRSKLLVDWLEVWRRPQWIEYAGRATGELAYRLQRLGLRMTPRAMTNSRFTLERMRAQGYSGPALIAGLVSDDLVIDPNPTLETPPMFLFVGRHIQDKRVETIPGALAQLRTTHPDARAVIVGTGPSTPLVEAEIHRLGLEEAIDMVGFVSEERLSELMGSARVMALPSRREGYGLVVVEAAAHGTPSVVVRAIDNAATALIREGLNGYIAASDSPEDLADAIRRAIDDGVSLRKSTAEWIEMVRNSESVEATARRLSELFAASER